MALLCQTLYLSHNPSLQHKLHSNGELDLMSRDENDSTLLHKAAAYGQLAVLQMLSKEVPSSFLQLPDNFFLTPAMLAIQVSMAIRPPVPLSHCY